MENVRISNEYVHIDLDSDTKFIPHNCGLEAIEITCGEARIAHGTYDVKFSYEHHEGYDDVTLVWITPRADHRQDSLDILNKIRESNGANPSDSSIDLVAQLKRNDAKMKGDLEDSLKNGDQPSQSTIDYILKTFD